MVHKKLRHFVCIKDLKQGVLGFWYYTVFVPVRLPLELELLII